MDKPAQQYYPHVDGLRAVAVLVVVLFHLGATGFAGGFVGVDVFFVISGYLITRYLYTELVETGGISFANFYTRRIRRLLPAYLVMLALVLVVAVLVFPPAKLERLGDVLRYAVVGMSNLVFWGEADYFDVAAQLKPLLHTWSLSVEEQFYLLWPALLLLIFRFARAHLRAALLVFGLASLFLNIVFVTYTGSTVERMPDEGALTNTKASLFFLTPFRMFEFVVGALLVCKHQASSRVTGKWLHWLGLACIAASVVLYNEDMMFPGPYALLPCVGAALVIYGGLATSYHGLLGSRVFTELGLLSYSLYLYHWPLIVFYGYVSGEALTFLDGAIILAASLALAWLSYRYVEEPFRRGRVFQRVEVRKLATVWCVLAMVALGALATNSGGWPSRAGIQFSELAHYGGDDYPRRGAMQPVGDEGERFETDIDIVIVGDSHGRQLAEGFYQQAVRRGQSVYIHAGTSCIHLPEMIRVRPAGEGPKCPSNVARVVDLVHAQAEPPVVVMAHSWLAQMARSRMVSAHETSTGNVDTQAVIRAIQEFAQSISPAQLVVVGQLPKTGSSLEDILLRPALFGQVALDTTYPLSANAQAFNRELAAAQGTGFVFFDPTTVFCSERRCRFWDHAGQPYFSDGSHLSKLGSRKMVEVLARMEPFAAPALAATALR